MDPEPKPLATAETSADSNNPMNVDVERTTKPLRKLRKLLKDFHAEATPEEVHDLRTRTRRLEAIVHALSPQGEPCARRLLKAAKPIRKAAGKVRDMDVLIAKLFSLHDETPGEGLLRLTEHLASLRSEHADRLGRVVSRRRKRLRGCLKRYAAVVEQSGSNGSNGRKGQAGMLAAPQILAAQLEHWPKLHEENLHEFRIHAKELRYMLQLMPSADRRHMDALGETKDVVGEWHDWLELCAIAEDLLDPDRDGEVLKRIAAITREKLRAALTAANRLRKVGFELPEAA